MLSRKQIFDAITMDGILAVDGTGVQSIINRLMDLQQQLLQQTPCTTLLPDEVRFRCTRFAHQCRLKGAVTNKDTVELYDKMFAGQ